MISKEQFVIGIKKRAEQMRKLQYFLKPYKPHIKDIPAAKIDITNDLII